MNAEERAQAREQAYELQSTIDCNTTDEELVALVAKANAAWGGEMDWSESFSSARERAIRRVATEKQLELDRAAYDQKITAEFAARQQQEQAIRREAWDVINSFQFPDGPFGIGESNSLLKAVRVVRSGWNRSRTHFVMLSAGGGIVRWYRYDAENLPKFAGCDALKKGRNR